MFIRGCAAEMRIIAMFILAIVFLFSVLNSSEFGRPGILSGYEDCEEHFEEGFQDYTDYCKYYYDQEDDERFAKNKRYEMVGNDIGIVKGYFKDCRRCMKMEGRISEYDFDSSCITEDDYVYIDADYDDEWDTCWSYDVYLYDIDEHILYFIHNNI